MKRRKTGGGDPIFAAEMAALSEAHARRRTPGDGRIDMGGRPMSDDVALPRIEDVPRPPWPVDWRCQDLACGHRRDEHASPLVEDGRCLHAVAGCLCDGWDPLTTLQWAAVMKAHHEAAGR